MYYQRFKTFFQSIYTPFLIFGITIDQITKYLATMHLSLWKGLAVIPPYIHFQLVHNYGAAYGILSHQRTLLITVSIGVLILSIVYHRLIVTTQWSKWGLTCLLIGTIGNLIDRIAFGYVIDFIDIKIFPVFNIADMMIDAGAICFVIDLFKQKRS